VIRGRRTAELVVDSKLKAKATVFQKTPPKFASVEKIRSICKCLRGVYLETHGEVAERLKAAVC